MSDLVRFTVSIERPLYERMQGLIESERYENRSEFIRDLVRGSLVDEEWKKNEEALGAITVIFDHHQRKLSERLTDLQHRFDQGTKAPFDEIVGAALNYQIPQRPA